MESPSHALSAVRTHEPALQGISHRPPQPFVWQGVAEVFSFASSSPAGLPLPRSPVQFRISLNTLRPHLHIIAIEQALKG